eukprot:3039488-Prymnesium_polylepis.1
MLSSAQTAWTKSNASCGSETRRALTPSAAYASTSFANFARLARSARVLPSPKIWQNFTRLAGVQSFMYDAIVFIVAKHTLRLRDLACCLR